MKTFSNQALRSQAVGYRARPASERDPQRTTAVVAQRRAGVSARHEPLQQIDQSPKVIAQRALSDGVHDSVQSKARREKIANLFGAAVQRASGALENDVLLQGRFETMQRMAEPEEEELLQGRFDTAQCATGPEEEELQMKPDSSLVATAQLAPAAKERRNDTGLPDALKFGIESLSGTSLDRVKVHYNSSQPAQLNALAYAQGSEIHLAPGQEKHLPHEAWHVVQQAQGRVRPTMQMMAGVPVNDDQALEREADVMGARAMGVQPMAQPPLQRQCEACDQDEQQTQRIAVPSHVQLVADDAGAGRRGPGTVMQLKGCYFYQTKDCTGTRRRFNSNHNAFNAGFKSYEQPDGGACHASRRKGGEVYCAG